MNDKLTPMFPPSIKPVHVGVYPTKHRVDFKFLTVDIYNYWNGKWWGSSATTPEGAYLRRNEKSNLQAFAWQGLARKPK